MLVLLLVGFVLGIIVTKYINALKEKNALEASIRTHKLAYLYEHGLGSQMPYINQPPC